MEMLKERANPNSQPHNILFQWEADKIQELSQWEDVEYEELSPWGFERYLEALQWGEERVYELFQWEFEKYQEALQWEDEKVQELPQCDNQRIQELSQSEGETVQELSPEVDVKVQELSQWEGKRGKELSQAEDDRDKVLCQWEGSVEQELSEGEVRVDPELSEGEVRARGDPVLSQEGDNIYQELLQENWEHIPSHTCWVNPKYPQLLWNPHPALQGSAQAAASPASWKQVKAAGAESPGPAPHSPCCPPSPSPRCQEGAMGETELPEPQTEQWSFAKEEKLWKYITIRTIWVNPKYPQLLQDPHPAPQESAQAEASPDSREQVPEAGAESQVPRKRPSCSRRVLRALRRLFRIPCMAGRPED
ncbi:PREDICTED: uncharacterized protein LOC108495300 [Lepidothrix coronata]|uniref:Uncharacterized protein LOC108495300 n=1 Tax=Lepidothrix coronata TaxID=321398 RepID=A0A6J0GWH5_9PASS|nr:PREDICTED: uncharacterized protein LOC108495300 [Lepidothrix coronata]